MHKILHFQKDLIHFVFNHIQKELWEYLPSIFISPLLNNFIKSEEYTGCINNVIKWNKFSNLPYLFNNNENTIFYIKKIILSLFLMLNKINCEKVFPIYIFLLSNNFLKFEEYTGRTNNANKCQKSCYIYLIIMKILHFEKKIFSLFLITRKINCVKK